MTPTEQIFQAQAAYTQGLAIAQRLATTALKTASGETITEIVKLANEDVRNPLSDGFDQGMKIFNFRGGIGTMHDKTEVWFSINGRLQVERSQTRHSQAGFGGLSLSS